MELLKTEEHEEIWEKFVELQEDVPTSLLIGWKKTIEKTYKNCKSFYFFDSKEKITKVLPFFLVESKLFGNRLISQPFIDFGGPFGEFDKNFIHSVIEELEKKFKEIRHIEIRLNTFIKNYEQIESCLFELGFKKESKRHQFILKLYSQEGLWERFDRLTKKAIKKAEKSELNLREISDEGELQKFYELYLNSMKMFGTPQHSYEFFLNLVEFMKENFKGFNCYKEGKLIASLIMFYTKDYMYAAYNFSERDYLKYQPNDFLYWEAIKWAIKNNIKHFDFGQTEVNAEENSHAAGIYKFKKKWLGELYERPYFYLSFNSKDKISDKKEKYEKAIAIWKKTPSSLIKIVGPKICSQLAL